MMHKAPLTDHSLIYLSRRDNTDNSYLLFLENELSRENIKNIKKPCIHNTLGYLLSVPLLKVHHIKIAEHPVAH